MPINANRRNLGLFRGVCSSSRRWCATFRRYRILELDQPEDILEEEVSPTHLKRETCICPKTRTQAFALEGISTDHCRIRRCFQVWSCSDADSCEGMPNQPGFPSHAKLPVKRAWHKFQVRNPYCAALSEETPDYFLLERWRDFWLPATCAIRVVWVFARIQVDAIQRLASKHINNFWLKHFGTIAIDNTQSRSAERLYGNGRRSIFFCTEMKFCIQTLVRWILRW